MFSFGSKVNVVSGLAVAAASGRQLPSNVPLCFPVLVQLNSPSLATFLSVNDGPVSDNNLASVGEDPGSISIRRSHFSTFQDWYWFALSAHVAVELSKADASFVEMLRVGRVPASVLFGMQ